jgi:cell division septal protein FtsQ
VTAIPRERLAGRPAPEGLVQRLGRALPTQRSLLIGGALLVGAALAYLVARETPLFALRAVEVRGADARVQGQVRATLEPAIGSSLVSLDGAEVIRRVEALPAVVSARYDRDFPHRLVVRVVPERPVAVLRQGGDAWLLSARGRVMAKIGRRAERAQPRVWLGRDVPLVLGARPGGEPGQLAPALSLLARSPLAGRVAAARSEAGELTLVLRSGVELLLGRPVDVGLKLAVATRVLQAVGTAAGGYVDLGVPARPVAKLNPQPED